jgi:hypothetical protein
MREELKPGETPRGRPMASPCRMAHPGERRGYAPPGRKTGGTYLHLIHHSAHRVAAKVAPVVRFASFVARPFACRPPRQKGTSTPKTLKTPH